MHAAAGILTTRGGMTSHAAVVARGMGRPCVVGAGAVRSTSSARRSKPAGRSCTKAISSPSTARPGRSSRAAYRCASRNCRNDFVTLMGWADSFRRMRVRANADTPADARAGACFRRRRHRALPHRAYVLRGEPHPCHARDDPRRGQEGRRAALAKLLPAQRQDFVELFRIMAGLPVTIRLLDPPLHEFLPHGDAAIGDVAAAMGVSVARLKRRVAA